MAHYTIECQNVEENSLKSKKSVIKMPVKTFKQTDENSINNTTKKQKFYNT